MAIAGAHAVRARITTTDHDDVLAVSPQLAFELVARIDLVLLGQELHGEMHARQFTPRHGQIARLLGATRQQHGIKVFLQLCGRNGLLGPVGHLRVFGHFADQHTGADRHAFLGQLVGPAVNVRFFHLEVRDAITQQATDAVVLFKQRHVMPDPCQLLGCRHAGWAGAHHGNLLAGFDTGRLRQHPALGPSAVDDGVLDRLDAHRFIVHVQRASRLAGCRTNTTGEFGKVVGAVQGVDRRLPVVSIHHVVEVRNDVVDRATIVAKRSAAIHATRRLLAGLLIIQTHHKLFVMLQALHNGLVALFDALKFHESSDFSHDSSYLVSWGQSRLPAAILVWPARLLVSRFCFFFDSRLRRFYGG